MPGTRTDSWAKWASGWCLQRNASDTDGAVGYVNGNGHLIGNHLDVGASTYDIHYIRADAWFDVQSSEVTLGTLPAGAWYYVNVGVLFDSVGGFQCVCLEDGTETGAYEVYIHQVTFATDSTSTKASKVGTIALTSGDRIKLDYDGTDLKVYKNDVEQLSWTRVGGNEAGSPAVGLWDYDQGDYAERAVYSSWTGTGRTEYSNRGHLVVVTDPTTVVIGGAGASNLSIYATGGDATFVLDPNVNDEGSTFSVPDGFTVTLTGLSHRGFTVTPNAATVQCKWW